MEDRQDTSKQGQSHHPVHIRESTLSLVDIKPAPLHNKHQFDTLVRGMT